MYSSIPDDRIFQQKPLWTQSSTFKLKSWTETVAGYLNEAQKLTTCLIRNRELARNPYTWFLTIYVDVIMQPKAINDWWKKAVRNLKRKGVVAIWIREPTRTNKVHYHLLLRSTHSKDDLEQIIEESLPSRTLGRWHKNLKPVKKRDGRLLRYITKAKTAGKTKSGIYVADLYRRKRLLFKSGLGIRKVGTIGKFWFKSREAIWNDVKAKEKRIAEGLAQENIKRLAQFAYELVDGYVPLQQIERNFGYCWDSPSTQRWIEQIFGHENRPSPNMAT